MIGNAGQELKHGISVVWNFIVSIGQNQEQLVQFVRRCQTVQDLPTGGIGQMHIVQIQDDRFGSLTQPEKESHKTGMDTFHGGHVGRWIRPPILNRISIVL